MDGLTTLMSIERAGVVSDELSAYLASCREEKAASCMREIGAGLTSRLCDLGQFTDVAATILSDRGNTYFAHIPLDLKMLVLLTLHRSVYYTLSPCLLKSMEPDARLFRDIMRANTLSLLEEPQT